jgi:hypothetical protein
MNKDVADAITKLASVGEVMTKITKLPTELDDRVVWPHNGTVWRRNGEDAWIPVIEGRDFGTATYPSRHVVSCDWKAIS